MNKDNAKIVHARMCIKALGLVIKSTREYARSLGLSKKEELMIWRKVLEIVASGGGKFPDEFHD